MVHGKAGSNRFCYVKAAPNVLVWNVVRVSRHDGTNKGLFSFIDAAPLPELHD